MAFAKQYYSSYKSSNGLDYYLEIWVDGFSGNASEITLGAGGPVISYDTEQEDRFSPIISSQCVLPFMVKGVGTQSFIQLLRTTYQERQVYLHLYRANSSTYSTVKPLWSGYLIMDLGSGEDVSFPYEQNLTFVDGLSVLKEIDFVQFPEGSPPSTPSDPNPIPFEDRTLGNYAPENMYWGPARYTYWIKEILLKSGAATTSQGASLDYGFTTAVNWYNGVMTSTSQSSDPLYLTESQASMFHTKDENNFFKPENCYEVLKELMRHWGCRITYWKHEFWIVQIPEYIEDESGFIDNPDNINSRQYNKSGTYLGSQDHLGDTYYTRYEQTIQSNQISKLVGTKYNYLPAIHRADATFLSLNSQNHFGGFPFGSNATTKDIFQGRILNPSNADFLWVSIPLNWEWDMTGAHQDLQSGHTKGWWCSIKFNLYAFQKIGNTTTEYYLQYDSSSGNYYWIEEANWVPLGNTSPKYIVKSRNLTETDYIGFQEKIPFVDSSGNNISMTGQWDFYISIENYGTSGSNPGSFYCRFSGYGNYSNVIKRNPTSTNPTLPIPGSSNSSSGTVSWTNSLQDNTLAQATPNIQQYPSSYNTGSSYNMDIKYNFVSPLKGFLQVLTTSQNSTYGFTNNTQITNSTNTESFSFGDLVWGDTVQSTARGMLGVYNGSDFVKTNPNGQWGRGTLSGTQTFTQILIDEFLTGQIKVLISPNMRLVVGEQNKDQTATASGGGTATRPRFVNPIGRLREFRTNAYDPEYIFRRGSFYSLFDEWDYEGYEILRDTITVTTVTNDIGGLGGAQDDAPIASAKLQGPVTSALMMNSPVAYVRQTVAATGSNVAVNGNFNVATGWTLGTGWSIDTTAKKANFTATGSTSDLTQSVLTQEKTFQINFTVIVTAGTLLVKAGSSGTTETITASGDYSIYLDCEGSSVIKFQAGTTFTGSITHVHIAEQKSLSSLPINSLGTTVFKTNDTFNLINSKGGEILPLTVSSNQGASDDTISVTSTALYDDIGIDSVLLINQDDLSAQYQNKTKGTVGGFDITATSIDSGSVAISSYIDDDTFATASATSLATSESIKAYVDPKGEKSVIQIRNDEGITIPAGAPIYSKGEIGGSERILVGISDASDSSKMPCIGIVETELNTTDNKDGFATTQGVFNTNISGFTGLSEGDILYVNSGSPPYLTQTKPTNGDLIQNVGVVIKTNGTICQGLLVAAIGRTNDVPWPLYVDHTNQRVGIGTSSPSAKLEVDGNIYINGSHLKVFESSVVNYYHSNKMNSYGSIYDWQFSGTNVMRIKSNANVLIGTTTDSGNAKLQVAGNIELEGSSGRDILFGDNLGAALEFKQGSDLYLRFNTTNGSEDIQVNKELTGTTATFIGQVTIPATPVASTDAASKGYVDAQVSATDSLQEVTTIGNTTTNSVMIGSSDAPLSTLHLKDGNVISSAYNNASLIIEGFSKSVFQMASYNTGFCQIAFGDQNDGFDGGIIYSNASRYMSFEAANAEKMRLTSTGRLGVSTSNPLATIHASGNIMTNAGGSWATSNGGVQLTYNSPVGYLTTYYDSNSLVLGAGITQKTGITINGHTSSAGNNIKFRVGNADSMALTTTGLGIGTTSPSQKLHVQTVNDTYAYYISNSSGSNRGGLYIDAGGDTELKLRTGSGDTVSLKADGNSYFNGGNVGIGTANPAHKLDISGGKIQINDGGATWFGSDATGGFIRTFNGNTFRFLDSSLGETMRIVNSTNNVLIGTTTDSGAKLDVSGVDNGVFFRRNTSQYFKFTTDAHSNRIESAGKTVFLGTTDAQPLYLKTNDSSRLTITSGGNVLIGTTTDSGNKLEVVGYVKASIGYKTGTYGLIYESSNELNIKNTAYYGINFHTNNAQRMKLTNAGNLLIGTTTDDGSSKLQVDGDAKFLGATSGRDMLWDESLGTLILSDNAYLRIGSNNDMYFFHDGTNTKMRNLTGDLYIENLADDKDIIFQCDDGSGGITEYFKLDGSLATHNGSTTTATYTVWPDKSRIALGTGSDLKLYHDGSNSYIENEVGNLTIFNKTDDGDLIFASDNGSGGTETYFFLDGSASSGNPITVFPDSSFAAWGTSYDFMINHNGTKSQILNQNGNLEIKNSADDSDIILMSDDGSGGTTPYITLDGSQTTINLQKTVLIGTTTNTGAYKIDVAGKQRVQDTLELDDVLMLNAISTPSDPAAGKSVIYMDSSDGGIKCKINVGGTTVTRTLASFE